MQCSRVIVGWILAGGLAAGAAWTEEEEGARVRSHTEFLSSDALEGRGAGSDGGRKAQSYVADRFEEIGLLPGAAGSYRQEFQLAAGGGTDANVVGWIEARESTRRSLVFTAHLDAYGIQEVKGETDHIFNGAVDNAVGVAALVELARRLNAGPPPSHNLVFVATAAEEGGMEGSRHYVEHPLFPLDGISMVLNIDGFNVRGPREDYYVMPRKGVDFVDDVRAVAGTAGWVYDPPEWIDEMDRNFDTASFLELGVPALTLWTGDRLPGGEPAAPIEMGRIHTPHDEINQHWDWSGVAAHLDLYEALAREFDGRPSRDGLEVSDPSRFGSDRGVPDSER